MKYKFTSSGMSEITAVSALKELGELQKGEDYGRLLVLDARHRDAINFIELVRAANLIIEGVPDQFSLSGTGIEIPDDPTEREQLFELVFRSVGYFEHFTYRQTLPVAVAVATRAWSDSSLVYAIHKLAQSYMLESVSPHSMHPRYEQVFQKHTNEFSSHVGTSVAINLAYSAIQELGLDVRSSSQNPRWLNNKEFIWNPSVLSNLLARLKAAGIDPDKTIDWVVRGIDTEVEVHPIRDSYVVHSYGGQVRDIELSLPDAINSCEYLRNFMTAHAFRESTSLLGPYEVYNTQQVARYLILSKCNLWNTWTKDLRAHFG